MTSAPRPIRLSWDEPAPANLFAHLTPDLATAGDEAGVGGAMKAERVTYRPEGGRARTVILSPAHVSAGLLTGVEVDETGEQVAGRGFDERVHVLDLDLVEQRVPLTMRDGLLCPAQVEEAHP